MSSDCNEPLEVYKLFKMSGLNLPSHLINIFKKLGYNDLHTLDQIESPNSLQDTIIEFYGDSEDYRGLTDDAKQSNCWAQCVGEIQLNTSFFPEKRSFVSIKALCSKLLQKLSLIYTCPDSSAKNTTKNE